MRQYDFLIFPFASYIDFYVFFRLMLIAYDILIIHTITYNDNN